MMCLYAPTFCKLCVSLCVFPYRYVKLGEREGKHKEVDSSGVSGGIWVWMGMGCDNYDE